MAAVSRRVTAHAGCERSAALRGLPDLHAGSLSDRQKLCGATGSQDGGSLVTDLTDS
jgi:hypothetical protein